MTEAMIFLELFSTFFIIGMFTIGGGYAMLSLIQNKVSQRLQVITSMSTVFWTLKAILLR